MRTSTCLVAALGIALWIGTAHATPGDTAKAGDTGKPGETACALLTPQELAGALGGEVGASKSSDTPYAKGALYDHDGVTHMCGLTVGARTVTLTYTTRAVTAEGRKSYQARLAQWEQTMREKGATVVVSDVGGIRCDAVTAGESGTELPGRAMVHCTMTAGVYSLSLSVSGAQKGDAVPVEKVRALVDKASTRLP